MKKTYYSLAAAAMLVLASCANDDYVAGETEAVKQDAIGFGFNVPNQSRADAVGSAAATKLSNEFIVFGTKHSAAEDGTATNDATVYTNYTVTYKPNTAGTTESNSANWEYAGKTSCTSGVSPVITGGTQAVKYWDYSAASGYTFTAFAGKTELANGNVTVEKVLADPATANQSKYNKGYEVTAKSADNLNNIYFSDRVEVAKDNYGKPVVLTFRNFGSRVRVGFYETVPGYTVKIKKFYYDADATAAVTTYGAMTDANTTNFAAALYNVTPAATSGNTLTVTYNDNNSGIENQPKVANTTVTYTPTLTLGTGVVGTTLATSSANPTWDNSGNYTTVYPNEACNNPMLIRCDYTLTSEDGSQEEIEVKNARVVVPAEYLKWKPNFAYTYIFKISDKTNGTTGNNPQNPDQPGTDDDPEGLHPITFDAVVIDQATGNTEDVATLSTNSVITYAKGSDVTANAEYAKGEPVYVVTENTVSKETITPSGIGTAATEAQVYKLGKAATESEVCAQLNGAKLGITTTAVTGAEKVSVVPAADGTNMTIDAVKFTPAETGTYAYVYTTTAYVAPTYVKADDYDGATTYYFKTSNDVYYPASGINAGNFGTYKQDLYTQTNAGTTGVYDIKVITVK